MPLAKKNNKTYPKNRGAYSLLSGGSYKAPLCKQSVNNLEFYLKTGEKAPLSSERQNKFREN